MKKNRISLSRPLYYIICSSQSQYGVFIAELSLLVLNYLNMGIRNESSSQFDIYNTVQKAESPI